MSFGSSHAFLEELLQQLLHPGQRYDLMKKWEGGFVWMAVKDAWNFCRSRARPFCRDHRMDTVAGGMSSNVGTFFVGELHMVKEVRVQ